MKRANKALNTLLSITLAAGLLPVPAFADEPAVEPTAQPAAELVEEAVSETVLEPLEVSSYAPISLNSTVSAASYDGGALEVGYSFTAPCGGYYVLQVVPSNIKMPSRWELRDVDGVRGSSSYDAGSEGDVNLAARQMYLPAGSYTLSVVVDKSLVNPSLIPSAEISVYSYPGSVDVFYPRMELSGTVDPDTFRTYYTFGSADEANESIHLYSRSLGALSRNDFDLLWFSEATGDRLERLPREAGRYNVIAIPTEVGRSRGFAGFCSVNVQLAEANDISRRTFSALPLKMDGGAFSEIEGLSSFSMEPGMTEELVLGKDVRIVGYGSSYQRYENLCAEALYGTREQDGFTSSDGLFHGNDKSWSTSVFLEGMGDYVGTTSFEVEVIDVNSFDNAGQPGWHASVQGDHYVSGSDILGKTWFVGDDPAEYVLFETYMNTPLTRGIDYEVYYGVGGTFTKEPPKHPGTYTVAFAALEGSGYTGYSVSEVTFLDGNNLSSYTYSLTAGGATIQYVGDSVPVFFTTGSAVKPVVSAMADSGTGELASLNANDLTIRYLDEYGQEVEPVGAGEYRVSITPAPGSGLVGGVEAPFQLIDSYSFSQNLVSKVDNYVFDAGKVDVYDYVDVNDYYQHERAGDIVVIPHSGDNATVAQHRGGLYSEVHNEAWGSWTQPVWGWAGSLLQVLDPSTFEVDVFVKSLGRTLVQGVDYVVSLTTNLVDDAGKALSYLLEITGIGHFAGKVGNYNGRLALSQKDPELADYAFVEDHAATTELIDGFTVYKIDNYEVYRLAGDGAPGWTIYKVDNYDYYQVDGVTLASYFAPALSVSKVDNYQVYSLDGEEVYRVYVDNGGYATYAVGDTAVAELYNASIAVREATASTVFGSSTLMVNGSTAYKMLFLDENGKAQLPEVIMAGLAYGRDYVLEGVYEEAQRMQDGSIQFVGAPAMTEAAPGNWHPKAGSTVYLSIAGRGEYQGCSRVERLMVKAADATQVNLYVEGALSNPLDARGTLYLLRDALMPSVALKTYFGGVTVPSGYLNNANYQLSSDGSLLTVSAEGYDASGHLVEGEAQVAVVDKYDLEALPALNEAALLGLTYNGVEYLPTIQLYVEVEGTDTSSLRFRNDLPNKLALAANGLEYTLVQDVDYKITRLAKNGKRVSAINGPGSYIAILEGMGNWEGERWVSFDVSTGAGAPDLASCTLEVANGAKYLPLSQSEPQVKVTLGSTELTEGVDYLVEYGNNATPGRAYAKVVPAPGSSFTGYNAVNYTLYETLDLETRCTIDMASEDGRMVPVVLMKDTGAVVPRTLYSVEYQMRPTGNLVEVVVNGYEAEGAQGQLVSYYYGAAPTQNYSAWVENGPQNAVALGGQFTVDVVASSTENNLACFQATLNYDKTKLRLVSVSSTLPGMEADIDSDRVAVYELTASTAQPLVIATATFEALEEGEASVGLRNAVGGTAAGVKDISLFMGPRVPVTVVDDLVFTASSDAYAGAYHLVKLMIPYAADSTPTLLGRKMAWDERAHAYLGLAESAAVPTLSAANFDRVSGAAERVTYEGDLNGNGLVNIVDAQIAYDIAVNRHQNFEVVSQLTWLCANVHDNGYLDAGDARAIQHLALQG